MSRVNAQGFYAEYHGHTIRDLTNLVAGLRSQDKTRSFVYLAGDSTLDNKHWLFGRSGVKNLQEEVKAGVLAWIFWVCFHSKEWDQEGLEMYPMMAIDKHSSWIIWWIYINRQESKSKNCPKDLKRSHFQNRKQSVTLTQYVVIIQCPTVATFKQLQLLQDDHQPPNHGGVLWAWHSQANGFAIFDSH